MMKALMRILMPVAMVALLLCAAGYGKAAKKKTATDGITATAATPATGQTVAEGVEDWENMPDLQTGSREATEQTAGQQASESTAGQQATEQTNGQQTENQEQTGPKKLTLAEYEALTTAQKQAYFESFPTPEAFYEWLEEAEKAAEGQGNTVTGDGTLDLNDYIK